MAEIDSNGSDRASTLGFRTGLGRRFLKTRTSAFQSNPIVCILSQRQTSEYHRRGSGALLLCGVYFPQLRSQQPCVEGIAGVESMKSSNANCGYDESKQLGLSCRERLKRSDQAKWDAGKRSHDPIELLMAANKSRIPELLPIKMGRMAASPFGFFRGAVPLMAADLATLPVTKIEVQICGDAHVRNMGCFATPDGRLIFDVNDFDETIPGPWEWDVKRLATSLILAGREAGDSDRLCRESVQLLMRSYREAMLRFAQMPRLELARIRVHRLLEGDPVRSVLHKAARATPLQNLAKLTMVRRNGARTFKVARPFLTPVKKPLSTTILRALESYRKTLAPDRQHVLSFYRPVDIAFKVVGTGSVGTRDYLVLHFGNGSGDPLFLQVKEEPPSAYAPYLRDANSVPNQGQRVVEGQRRMQTQSDLLLG